MHSYRSANDGLAYAPEALTDVDSLPATGERLRSQLNTSVAVPNFLLNDAAVEVDREDKHEHQQARVFSLDASALYDDRRSQPRAGQRSDVLYWQLQQNCSQAEQVRQSKPILTAASLSWAH